ncbi:MAG: PAS domain-containing protein, partial [Bacteroidales bacterium]|nr:PAS domain-containing protein [Bacteroidales bacterium]
MKKQRHKDFIKNRIKALFGKEKPLEAKALDEFVEDIADHQQTLQERIKELNCLYEASSLMADKEIATDQFMQSLSNIIKQAWQFPEITCVKIKIDGNEYLTANYSDTPWKLTSPVTMDGKDMGLLQVCYLEEKSASDEGPFLKEERNLLETIAGNLSQSLQNMKSEELLKKSRQRLLDAQRIAKMGDFTWNVQTGEVQWSKAMYELLGYDEDEKINFEKVNVDIHHPDDLERVIDWLNRCIKSGETHHEHQGYRVVTKD